MSCNQVCPYNTLEGCKVNERKGICPLSNLPRLSLENLEKDFAFMDYQSPIEAITKKIASEVANKFDNQVWTAIQEVGIVVDKDELVKALKYDRDQYIKGYADGFANADKEIAERIFEDIERILSDNFHADCQMGDCIEDYYDDNLRDDIAEIRKKYTEGKKDENQN